MNVVVKIEDALFIFRVFLIFVCFCLESESPSKLHLASQANRTLDLLTEMSGQLFPEQPHDLHGQFLPAGRLCIYPYGTYLPPPGFLKSPVSRCRRKLAHDKQLNRGS